MITCIAFAHISVTQNNVTSIPISGTAITHRDIKEKDFTLNTQKKESKNSHCFLISPVADFQPGKEREALNTALSYKDERWQFD